MLVDWRGVAIVLAVLAAVGVLCAIDLSCTSGREPGVLTHVKAEARSGKREFASLKRDELAEQLRGLRVLNKRLAEQGELTRVREVTRLIIDLEKQYQRLSSQAEGAR